MPHPEKSVAIVGWDEGGAGQVHAWIERVTGWRVACFVHTSDEPPSVDIAEERSRRDSRLFEFPKADSFKGVPLLSTSQWPERLVSMGIPRVLVMSGDPERRLDAIHRARGAGLLLASAIHPTATLMEGAVLGENVVLHARAFVGYRAQLSDGVSVNTGAQLDHHNVVRECATIDPGVVTAGNVTIGRFARVHTRAVIVNRVRIGDGAVVGAGAVVLGDVPPGETVVGVPARPIERRRAEP